MPNRLDLTDVSLDEIANCIHHWLSADDRTPGWLAKKAGIADSTLRFWLDERPDRLTVIGWLAILAAMGRTVNDLTDTVNELRSTSLAGAA